MREEFHYLPMTQYLSLATNSECFHESMEWLVPNNREPIQCKRKTLMRTMKVRPIPVKQTKQRNEFKLGFLENPNIMLPVETLAFAKYWMKYSYFELKRNELPQRKHITY